MQWFIINEEDDEASDFVIGVKSDEHYAIVGEQSCW